MSLIKDGRYPIELGGKERHLLFSLNVLDVIEDKYGGLDSLGEKMNSIHEFRWLLTTLLNEGRLDDEDELTELQVGRMIHTGNFAEVKDHIFKAFSMGITGEAEPAADPDEDNEDSERKNA